MKMVTPRKVSVLFLISITCCVSCFDNAPDGDRIDDMEGDILEMKIAIDRLEQKVLANKISLRTGLKKQISHQVRGVLSEMLQHGLLQDMMRAQIAAEMKQMKQSYHQMKQHLIHVSKTFMDLRKEMSVVQAAILKGGNSCASASGDNEVERKQQNTGPVMSNSTQESAQMKATRGSFNCTETNTAASTSMPLRTSTQQPYEYTKMAVPNFSFESKSSWLDYGDGWALSDNEAQDGDRSAEVTNGGAYQEFVFATPVRKFIISGYSKNVGGRNSIATPSDYSLYCDLRKPSGSYLWGYIAAFTPGRNSWHKVQVNVSLSKDDAVVMARCHLLYRDSASVGTAYFDNVALYRLSDDATDFTQCPTNQSQVSVQPFSNEYTKMAVPNFSFESKSSWLDYGDGWTLNDNEAQDGNRSAEVTNGGAYQEFVFATPVRKFIISGYSKNVGGRNSIATPSDYSLYCDLRKPSGTYLWGYIAAFTPGRNSWHKVQVNVSLSKDDAVVMARCHLLYRDSASVGTAYFDNVALYRLSDDATDFTQCPTNQSQVSIQPFSNECTKMAVPNFSFESKSSWLDYGDGWTLNDNEAQDGNRSAEVTNGGAYQEFVFATPVRKFIISGFSKNVGGRNSIATPSDYSLYCDLRKPSGSYLWGYIAAFTPGQNSWHKVQVDVNLSEAHAVVMARCYLLYRDSASAVGTAYFDNVTLYRLSDDATDFTQCQ